MDDNNANPTVQPAHDRIMPVHGAVGEDQGDEQALRDKLTSMTLVADAETVAHLAQCAVCLSSEADIELINCGDQLCFECLEQYLTTLFMSIRYLAYTLQQSLYNIKPVIIECPLCECPMDVEDWEPYVKEEIIELYDRCLWKNRSVMKQCPKCTRTQGYVTGTDSSLTALTEIVGRDCSFVIKSKLDIGATNTAYAIWIDSLQSGSSADNLVKTNQAILSKISAISAQSFYRAQLVALDSIPSIACTDCDTVYCIRCGQNGDHTQCKIDYHGHDLSTDNRPCPRCHTTIIREEESCNEMNCDVCGKKFCWQCLRTWSRECGIYKCLRPLFPRSDEEEAEALKTKKKRKDKRQKAKKGPEQTEANDSDSDEQMMGSQALVWELHNKIQLYSRLHKRKNNY